MKDIEENEEVAKLEGEIATLIARIQSSSLYAAGMCKEPYDQTTAMIPAAYAFFEILVRAGIGSGHEDHWNQFLTEVLSDVIAKSDPWG